MLAAAEKRRKRRERKSDVKEVIEKRITKQTSRIVFGRPIRDSKA